MIGFSMKKKIESLKMLKGLKKSIVNNKVEKRV